MEKRVLVFMPTPGAGHLVSAVELAKNLSSCFSATILTIPHVLPSLATATDAYIDTVVASGLDVAFHRLPVVNVTHRENSKGETFITRLVDAYRSPARDFLSRHLSSPSPRPIAAMILDLFCTSLIDVAGELDIPSYIYFTSNAAMLGSMLYLPTIVNKPEGDIFDYPCLPPVPALYLPDPLKDRTDESYHIMVEHCRKFCDAKGFIVNTFAELEPKAMRALEAGECTPGRPTPPVFTVGPLLGVQIQPNNSGAKHQCLDWLDGQPEGSVVFLCFGSMGSFEAAQVAEMASGLERSGQRFLWALRSPSAGQFRMPIDADLDAVLPEGFLERTRGRGMVWPSWAPQVDILAHPAVGGFVTHCGWNSVLESLWFGRPMLAWPLYAEQHLNGLQMVRDLGIALELGIDYGNGRFVSSEEVERGVRWLMGEEGMEVRAKVGEMMVASRKAVENGGSSRLALERLMEELTKETPVKNSENDDCCIVPEVFASIPSS